MVCGRRMGRIGLALWLGVVVGLGTPGCSRKPTQEAGTKESAAKIQDGLKTMHPDPARPSVTPHVTALSGGSGSSPGNVAPGAPSASKLYAQARSAWLAGECEKSIGLARQANRIKFSTRHVSIIGACACSLRWPATAKWAYRILRGGQRRMLIQICSSKGIDVTAGVRIDEPSFVGRTPQPSPEPQRPVPSDSADFKSASDLSSLARKAWLAGQCSKATRLAMLANRKQRSPSNWAIIGACACILGRKSQAKLALAELRGANRSRLIATCRTKGIRLD